jgi:hypothetical protein
MTRKIKYFKVACALTDWATTWGKSLIDHCQENEIDEHFVLNHRMLTWFKCGYVEDEYLMAVQLAMEEAGFTYPYSKKRKARIFRPGFKQTK